MKKLFLLAVLSACQPQPTPQNPPATTPDAVSDICSQAQANLLKLQCPNLAEPDAGVLGSPNLKGEGFASFCQSSFIVPLGSTIPQSPLHPVCLSQATSCQAVTACSKASQ
jgi:hypothetical protein